MEQIDWVGKTYDKAISYSGLSTYRECPKRWHDSYILKNKYPSGAAASRGTRIHEAIEDYFGGTEVALGRFKELKPWGARFFDIQQIGGAVPELKLGVNEETWEPSTFDHATGYRGAIDLSQRLPQDAAVVSYDWKTGRVYDKHVEQGKFYACLQQAHEPDAQYQIVRFVYIDHPPKTTEWIYQPDQISEMQAAFTEEIKVLRGDDEWKPKPSNDSCKWCPLSWRRGGNCTSAP